MADAPPAVPAEFDDELMELESSETDAPSPMATVNSPTTVIAVLAPTESTIVQLRRLQVAFRRRRELAPAAKVFQRLWRARQKRHGALHAGSVRTRISAHLLPLLKPHQKVGVRWAFDRLHIIGGCMVADEPGLGKTIQASASPRFAHAPARPPSKPSPPFLRPAGDCRDRGHAHGAPRCERPRGGARQHADHLAGRDEALEPRAHRAAH